MSGHSERDSVFLDFECLNLHQIPFSEKNQQTIDNNFFLEGTNSHLGNAKKISDEFINWLKLNQLSK